VQWTPSLWKQPDGEGFESEIESKSVNSPISRKRQRLRIKIFSGVNNLFIWVAAIGTLLVISICVLTINTIVRGGSTNSFTAPIVSRALTLVPLPTPTLGAGSVRVSPEDGMRMVYVPAGEFMMGCEDFQDDEKPIHRVHLDSFWIDQYEVTNGMYAKCVETDICGLPFPADMFWQFSFPIEEYRLFGPGDSKFFDQLATDPEFFNQPVMNVPWDFANAYCRWVGRRLPTEAEWEKAARGVDGRTYPWGEEADCTKANLFSCAGNPSRVGSFEDGQSPYGAYDMAGNALEWVADWYDRTYYQESPHENPLGPTTGLYRVYRGGSWGNEETSSRVTNRPGYVANLPLDYIGFRCAGSE
jgi:formylglycine-generating enzyme required for sulfatase activity